MAEQVEQRAESTTVRREGAGRTFRPDEAERVIEEIISEYGLGYTEMTMERIGGKVKFVRFQAVMKIEED